MVELETLFAGLATLVADLRKRDPAGLRRELRRLSWVHDESCPFCGCESVGTEVKGLSVVAYCEECDAEGPPTHTRERALELWKRRAN